MSSRVLMPKMSHYHTHACTSVSSPHIARNRCAIGASLLCIEIRLTTFDHSETSMAVTHPYEAAESQKFRHVWIPPSFLSKRFRNLCPDLYTSHSQLGINKKPICSQTANYLRRPCLLGHLDHQPDKCISVWRIRWSTEMISASQNFDIFEIFP